MNLAEDLPADQALRLECARIAVAQNFGVALARELYEFVLGDSDKSPREHILAVLDEAGVR